MLRGAPLDRLGYAVVVLFHLILPVRARRSPSCQAAVSCRFTRVCAGASPVGVSAGHVLQAQRAPVSPCQHSSSGSMQALQRGNISGFDVRTLHVCDMFTDA